ncbi:APC family permease [Hyphomicrobium facile]|uniref:Amino acid transporter n=1 Tax=Hyphomicrobium facile TaxID=51670 RepID=A0A1I7MWG4_9HYPH|nr:APC family permease [Hyphomicrobium facile]SFV26762.1 Amino acid transporter [Hyphomicrobium facile]
MDSKVANPEHVIVSSSHKENMVRAVSWWEVVFIALGACALVMFSLGGISAVTGTVSPLVWTVSATIGLIATFVYAEMAAMLPNKSGGTANYGATAWIRHIKVVAPMSVWGNWIAYSPILAIGSGLGAGYVLSVFVPPDHVLNTWSFTLVDLNAIKPGLTLRLNMQFVLGTLIMLTIWAIQHAGITRTARVQIALTLGGLFPLVLVCFLPLFGGKVTMEHFTPFVPLNGAWDFEGWKLFFGGLFIAAWSAYAAESSVCFMSEMRDPETGGPKAVISTGVICLVVYALVSFVFQGGLGTEGMLSPGIQSGEGVGAAFAGLVGAGPFFTNLLVVMLIFSLLLGVMTAMADSARTLYQGAHDGWFPKYLDHLNEHGVPTRAMWVDLFFNAFLLLMSDYLFVLAVSAVNYLMFHTLNMSAAWIHRIDNPRSKRPYRASMFWLVVVGCLSFVNAFLIGAGANVWGDGVLPLGFTVLFAAVPVFLYRHYVTDGGKFPDYMLSDLIPPGETELTPTRAGILPYLALAGNALAILIGYQIFWGS